jgi:serine/threonine protein kinase
MGASESRIPSQMIHKQTNSMQSRVKLDKYSVGTLLAKTPHSINFEGIDLISHERVALKILNPPESDCEQQLINNEINIMRNIKHPNILPFIDVLNISHRSVIITPLAYGTLNMFIHSNQQNTEPFVRHVIYQLLNGLKYLHDHSIIHRDVKPANIYVMNKQRNHPDVVLADFGSATYIHQHLNCEIVGTAAFIAPEIWNSQNCIFLSDFDYRLS